MAGPTRSPWRAPSAAGRGFDFSATATYRPEGWTRTAPMPLPSWPTTKRDDPASTSGRVPGGREGVGGAPAQKNGKKEAARGRGGGKSRVGGDAGRATTRSRGETLSARPPGLRACEPRDPRTRSRPDPVRGTEEHGRMRPRGAGDAPGKGPGRTVEEDEVAGDDRDGALVHEVEVVAPQGLEAEDVVQGRKVRLGQLAKTQRAHERLLCVLAGVLQRHPSRLKCSRVGTPRTFEGGSRRRGGAARDRNRGVTLKDS